MRRILFVALASMIAASRASAADLPVPAPAYYPAVTVVYDWGGGYIGINGGYAFGRIVLDCKERQISWMVPIFAFLLGFSLSVAVNLTFQLPP